MLERTMSPHGPRMSSACRTCVWLALLGLMLAGCAEVHHLRDAQTAFNQAARLDNELTLLGADPVTGALQLAEVRAGYMSAIASIDRMKANPEDNLWGVALTIKAMSYWRLGDYQKMEEVQAELQKVKDKVYPRDQALMLALPGLWRIDEAQALLVPFDERQYTTAQDKEKLSGLKREKLEEVETLIAKASEHFADARRVVPGEHQVRAYLIQAELAGLKNLWDARVIFAPIVDGMMEPRSPSDEERQHVRSLIRDLDCAFRGSLRKYDLEQAQQIVRMWADAFGQGDISCGAASR